MRRLRSVRNAVLPRRSTNAAFRLRAAEALGKRCRLVQVLARIGGAELLAL